MVNHPENYLTLRYQRLDTALIAAEYVNLAQLSKVGDSKVDTTVESQKKLLEIEQHLTQAHTLYFKRQYQQAIDEYKITQNLIYRMLFPGLSKAVARRPEIEYPIGSRLFEALLGASLEYVEALAPQTISTSFGSAFVDIPQDEIAKLAPYEELGVNLAENIPRQVIYDSQLAASYVERGQWERAEYFYQRARRNLEGIETPEAISAKAALELSLGGVYIQLGRTAEAKALLGSAAETFGAVEDPVGQAQASLNLAAALVKEENGEQASKQLEQAKQLLARAQGVARITEQPRQPSAEQPITPRGIRPDIRPDVTPGISFRPDLLTDITPRINITNVRPISTGSLVRALSPNRNLAAVVDLSAVEAVTRLGTVNPETLNALSNARGLGVTYRQLGRGSGWLNQPLESKVETRERTYVKELGILVGKQVFKAQWTAGSKLPVEKIVEGVYKWRVERLNLSDLIWRYDLPSDFAVQLPHLYFYVIPVALGDCYHALGEYDTAESYYLNAADYQYINTALEIPALWRKLAENTLAWGDWLYRNDEFQAALEIYRKVLEPPGTAAVVWVDSPLYKHAQLARVGEQVKSMLTTYETAGVGNLNPTLAAAVLEIRARVLQLNAGLDFLGTPANVVPIWSFEYLQNVARYFAQQAVQAEREFINFWDRAENESLTRQQLQQAVTLGFAEQELARQQREAADAEVSVYSFGSALATLRRQNVQQNRTDYANMSRERIWIDAANAFYGIGSQRKFKNGGKVQDEVFRLTERRGQITLDYELASMDRQIAELQQGEFAAQAQLAAANARVEAARQMEEVARLRTQAAQQNLDAFNNQFFTPEIWYQMGNFMRGISQSYLYMAIRIARLMQKAYNFENDLNRRFIKVDYSTNTVKGMLAADALLLDIESFTYDLITNTQRKQVPVKQTISLAQRYPFLFETQFRRTGKIDFETRLEDFDLDYPGTYSRRIESIEVEVEGILPESGVRGILTNGGISRYRTTDINQIKFRIQPKETLVLSEYRINQDAVTFPADPRKLKVFEGAGVAGSWTLEIPRASNDLDFNAITDIRLTFYYHARYDEALANAAKAQLASFAGVNLRSRIIPLRWAFPDAFFHFQDTGRLTFELESFAFPFNETNPQIRNLTMLVIPVTGVNPTSWNIRLGVPAHPATIAAQPNSQGEITATAGHPWQPLAAGTALGQYIIEMQAGENPDLIENGMLNLSRIQNIILVLEYEFTPRV